MFAPKFLNLFIIFMMMLVPVLKNGWLSNYVQAILGDCSFKLSDLHNCFHDFARLSVDSVWLSKISSRIAYTLPELCFSILVKFQSFETMDSSVCFSKNWCLFCEILPFTCLGSYILFLAKMYTFFGLGQHKNVGQNQNLYILGACCSVNIY